MSENLIQLAVTQFSALLEMKIQQTTSAFRGKVAEGTHKGKQASPVQYIGPVKFQSPAGRFAPLGRQDAAFERRWVFPKDRDLPQLIDSFDELRLISDPKSQYSSGVAAAAAREWDDQLIAAATADTKTGSDVDALGTETFDTTKYRIADTFGTSGTAVGLTVAKLREVKRVFRHYGQDGNPDNEVVSIAIGSQQESDLLGQTEVTSLDYNSRPVLVDGAITRFMGFNFIVIERLPTYTTTTRGVIAWMKSGLYLGIWSDLSNEVSKRSDLSSAPWQLYSKFTCGATRLQAGKLLQVACKDATGASITP